MIEYTGILLMYVALITVAVFGACYIVHTLVKAVADTIRERETNVKEEKRKGKGKNTADH